MAMRELWRLPRVPLREIWKDERKDFTPWLERNVELLGLSIDLNLRPVDKEVRFRGPDRDYQPDLIVEVSETRERVVVENQLNASDEGHFNRLVPYAQSARSEHVIWVAPSFRLKHRDGLARLNEKNDDVTVYRGVRVTVVRINGWMRGVSFSEVEPHHNGYFVKKVHLFVDTGEWRLNDAVLTSLACDHALANDFALLGWEWDKVYSHPKGQNKLSGWVDPSGNLQRLSTIEADRIDLLTPILPKLESVFQETKSGVRQRENELERLIREWRSRKCCCNRCCRQCPSEACVCGDCYCEWCFFDMVFPPLK